MSDMPPLPEPYAVLHHDCGDFTRSQRDDGRERLWRTDAYTADQMHAYARAYAEQETAALRAEVERLRQEHHLMLGALADIGFCEGGDVDIDRFRQKARRIYNATSKA